MARGLQIAFPWRLAIFAPATAVLFCLALYFYDNLQPRVGLGLLGGSFTVPMVWVVLAARDAEYSDSSLRAFVPRLTVWLVLGSVMLGAMHWNTDRPVSLMEAGFGVVYLASSRIAIRILDRRPKRPQLTAISGGNLERPQRRRSR
jgi:sterol desaturase/sphingolipid hydroxylase (fatty acid hydroxylase superfamily)